MTLTMFPVLNPLCGRPAPLPTTLLNPRYHHSVLCDCGAAARYAVSIRTTSATGRPIRDHLNLCPACYRLFQEQEPTMPPEPITQMLPVDLIRLDGDTQMRARIDPDTVARYADDMAAGDEFPAIHVYQDDDGVYWCADGEHRVLAHRMVYPESSAVVPPIKAVVHDGTRRDAMLYAATANKTHGLPRTNADKRFAVERFLRDAEWGKLSDREIARMTGVSNRLVGMVRDELTVKDSQSTVVTFRVGADGRTIDTANIGRRSPARLTREYETPQPKTATVVYSPPASAGHMLDGQAEAAYAAPVAAAVAAAMPTVNSRTAAPQPAQLTTATQPSLSPPPSTSDARVAVPAVPLGTGPGGDLAARRAHLRQLRAVYQAARECVRAYEEATGDFDSGLPLGRVLPGMVATLDRHLAALTERAAPVGEAVAP